MFSIRNDLYDRLKSLKGTNLAFSDVIDNLLKQNDNLQEAIITNEGRVSKSLAGKTILYRIK